MKAHPTYATLTDSGDRGMSDWTQS